MNQHTLIGAGGVGDLDGGCRVSQGDRDLIGIRDVHRAAALGLGHFFIVTVVRGSEMFVRHRLIFRVGRGLGCAEKEGPDGNADGQKRDHGGENEVGFRATIHRQNFLSSAVKFILPHGAKFSNSCRKI